MERTDVTRDSGAVLYSHSSLLGEQIHLQLWCLQKACPWGQEAPIHLSINVWRGLVSSKRGKFFGLIAAPCLHPNREHFAMDNAHVPEHCGLTESANTIAFTLKGSWSCSQIAMQTHLPASRTTVPSFSLKRHFCFVVD